MPVLLVRHAHALPRRPWTDDDALRPLSDRGRHQAAALVPLLSPYGPVQVRSSPAVRCVETVAPLAGALRIDVAPDADLAEGAGDRGVNAVLARVDGDEVVVACSHGDVIDELLQALMANGSILDGGYHCAKGALWVLDRPEAGPVRARYLPPPTPA